MVAAATSSSTRRWSPGLANSAKKNQDLRRSTEDHQPALFDQVYQAAEEWAEQPGDGLGSQQQAHPGFPARRTRQGKDQSRAGKRIAEEGEQACRPQVEKAGIPPEQAKRFLHGD
jgi:hypothetical protein